MSRDFFKYLSELPKQDRYSAPGSNQHVKVKKAFQRKAKKAYDLCLDAIAAENSDSVNDKWKKVYGRPFPAGERSLAESTARKALSWENTEQFIEDRFKVDVRYNLTIDCDVKQNGFREHTLRHMLAKRFPLLARRGLEFYVSEVDVPGNYAIYWKVLNRGEEAQRRDQVRGQIVSDGGYHRKKESSTFKGDHIVECYAVQNGVVVAKDRIHVPISANS
jgi:hypothetical protein